MNDTENSLVFALTGKSGQQHGIVALLAVIFNILAEPEPYLDVFATFGIALTQRAYLPSVQGDTPAMAEMLNRCGHSSQQACFKCWAKGDIACKTFESLKGSNSTYALQLEDSAATKSESELREATAQYKSLATMQGEQARDLLVAAEAAHRKARKELASSKRSGHKKKSSTKRPQRQQGAAATLGSGVGQKRAKSSGSKKKKKKKKKKKVKSLLLETIQRRVAGQGATPWLILHYVMMTMFGGIDDGMHTLIIGVNG